MTKPIGLTPAWWQVLGATLDEPRTVSDIARRVGLGLARQSVQRVADLLVARGWAAYRENPRHRRAKLLEPTEADRATVRRYDGSPPTSTPGRTPWGRTSGSASSSTRSP